MLRFKHFTGSSSDLEQAINEWLEQYEPEVTQMVQSYDGKGALTIGFLFEESFRGQELRLAAKRGMSGATVPAVPPELVPDEPLHVTE
jgi:hypothetical protein